MEQYFSTFQFPALMLIHEIRFLKTGKQANVRDAIAIAEVDQLKFGTHSDKKRVSHDISHLILSCFNDVS